MITAEAVAPHDAIARPIGQLSVPAMLALHLMPGVLMTAGFVAFAPIVELIGLPPIAALLAAIVLILVPVELGVLVRAARAERVPIAGLIPWQHSIRPRDWAVLVPTLIVLAFLGFGLHAAIEPALIERLFAWLPEWYVSPIVIDLVGDYSATAWIVTIAAYFGINSLLGPIVEELYFRGYLLPRMERLGRWAALVNVSLFSLYHLWSPWQLFARILGLAPTVYAVRRTRSVYLGMVVHCSLNTLGVLLVAMAILGRI
jgi:membrane protease YdiL (CAAX protease family)